MEDRDLRVLKFLTDVRIATNDNIQQAFFKGLNPNVCYRRLSYLVDCKLVKRTYFNIDGKRNIYIYYLDKKPSRKILEHDLLISKFTSHLISEGYEILEFEKTPIIAGIKPDAMIKFRSNDKIKYIFLEVQLSEHDCTSKYFNIKSKVNGEIPNVLYIVTNKDIKNTKLRDLKVVIDDLNFSKVKFYFS